MRTTTTPPLPCSTAMGLWFFLQNVEGLGFTFDTGNFAYSLEDASDGLHLLGRGCATSI